MAKKQEEQSEDSELEEKPKRGKAKKADESSSPQDRFSAAFTSETFSKIRKKYGEGLLMKASDYAVQRVPRIPTSIFPLDYALGGGFPAGRVNMLYGPKSASKTTTFLKTIANAQKMCAACWQFTPCECGNYREPVVAFFDVEGTLDAEWAQCHGVNTDRMLLSIPEFGEQVFDIGEGLLRSGDCDIMVVDSLAFLVPAKEVEELMEEKEFMGIQPRMIGKGIRKFIAAMNSAGNETGHRPTIFFTNQIRMKLGVMFGNPETTPGGMAAGFANSVEVRVSPGKAEVDEETGVPIAIDMRFKVEKNKCGPPKMEGEYRLYLSDNGFKKKGEIYDENIVIGFAQRMGLVTGAGASWKALGQQFGSKSAIEHEMFTNPEFSKSLRDATMKLLLNK